MSPGRSISRAEYHQLRRADRAAHIAWLASVDHAYEQAQYADRGGDSEIRAARARKPIPRCPRPEHRPELRIDNSRSYARRVLLNRQAFVRAQLAERDLAIAAFSDSICAYYRKAA